MSGNKQSRKTVRQPQVKNVTVPVPPAGETKATKSGAQVSTLTTLQGFEFVSVAIGKKREHGFGIYEAPIYYINKQQEKYESGRKVIVRNGIPVHIPSKRYTVIPNEQVLEMVEEAGFKPTTVNLDRNDNAMYTEIMSPNFEGAVDKGDAVRVGTIVTNSIDGSEPLAAHTYTYRLACGNGAVGSGSLMGGFVMKHVGERQKLIDGLRETLDQAMEGSKRLIEMYKKTLKIKIDEKIAEAITATKIADKYLPEYIQRGEKEKTILKDKNVTLWQGFNDLTFKLWHSPDLSWHRKISRTQVLHGILANATGFQMAAPQVVRASGL